MGKRTFIVVVSIIGLGYLLCFGFMMFMTWNNR